MIDKYIVYSYTKRSKVFYAGVKTVLSYIFNYYSANYLIVLHWFLASLPLRSSMAIYKSARILSRFHSTCPPCFMARIA